MFANQIAEYLRRDSSDEESCEDSDTPLVNARAVTLGAASPVDLAQSPDSAPTPAVHVAQDASAPRPRGKLAAFILLSALAFWMVDGYCQRISESYAHIPDGAERMAIGNRRYIQLAIDTPQWAMLLLQLVAAAPAAGERVAAYSVADLRLGLKQKRFRITNERAALDLIGGAVSAAMQSVATGQVSATSKKLGYDSAVARLVLQGLGMDPEDAAEIAKKPLPPMRAE